MEAPTDKNLWEIIAAALTAVILSLLGLLTWIKKRTNPEGMTNGNRQLLFDLLEGQKDMKQALGKLEDTVHDHAVEIAVIKTKMG